MNLRFCIVCVLSMVLGQSWGAIVRIEGWSVLWVAAAWPPMVALIYEADIRRLWQHRNRS